MPGAGSAITESHFDIPLQTGIVLKHQYIVPHTPLHKDSIDHTITGIVKEPGSGEDFKIPGSSAIQPVIVLFIFLSPGKAKGDRGSPYNKKLSAILFIKDLRRPYIKSIRLLLHNRDELLIAPVYQVFGAGIPESFITIPSRGPYQVPDTIRTLRHRWIPHQLLLPDSRPEPGPAKIRPTVAVRTGKEIESVRCRLPEG